MSLINGYNQVRGRSMKENLQGVNENASTCEKKTGRTTVRDKNTLTSGRPRLA